MGLKAVATDTALVTSLSTSTSSGVNSLSTSTSTGIRSLSTSTSTAVSQIPQNSKSADYTTVASDAGKQIFHPSSDANARTFTIDSNAHVAYGIGTAITFVNQSASVVTIAITDDTLTLANSTSTGNRSLAQNGIATALKVDATNWIISGTGLT